MKEEKLTMSENPKRAQAQNESWFIGGMKLLLLAVGILLVLAVIFLAGWALVHSVSGENLEPLSQRHWYHAGDGQMLRLGDDGQVLKHQWTAEKLTTHLRQGSEFHLLEEDEKITELNSLEVTDERGNTVGYLVWEGLTIQRFDHFGNPVTPLLRMGEFNFNLVNFLEDNEADTGEELFWTLEKLVEEGMTAEELTQILQPEGPGELYLLYPSERIDDLENLRILNEDDEVIGWFVWDGNKFYRCHSNGLRESFYHRLDQNFCIVLLDRDNVV